MLGAFAVEQAVRCGKKSLVSLVMSGYSKSPKWAYPINWLITYNLYWLVVSNIFP